MAVVIGVDAGGTGMRAVAVDHGSEGEAVLGSADGPAGNALSVPPDQLQARLTACVAACLESAGARPEEVGAVVAGLAGVRAAPHAADTVRAAVAAVGMACPVGVCSDVEVAFAGGSAEPDGVVLIAGTGASAARIRGFTTVATADGAGWLLGDDGSGFWIARQALHAVLASLDGRGPRTELAGALCAELGTRPVTCDVVAAAMAVPPPALARLAPRVLRVAEAGDEVAHDIVQGAVQHLAATATALGPRPDQPLVLAGGLIGAGGPLQSRVTAALSPSGRPVVVAVDTRQGAAVGAARLAAMALAENKFCH